MSKGTGSESKFKHLKPLACGFHSHSDYSLDGGSTVESRIIRAKNIGRVADCLTDHGIMSGLIPHWQAAEKHKIKSIHGIEAYIIDWDRPAKVSVYKSGKKKGQTKTEPYYYHQTIHFKNREAYFYFCKLTRKMEERAVVKFGERKPLMLIEELEAIGDHIVLGSGCLLGAVQKNILVGRPDLAEKNFQRLKSIVKPGCFFVEIFPHCVDHNWKRAEVDKNTKKIIRPGEFLPITKVRDWESESPEPEPDPCTGRLDIQKLPNQFLLSLSEKYKVPALFSLDDHFAEPGDKLCQDVRLGNGLESWKFFNSLHSMTSEEAASNITQQMQLSMKKIEEMIDNSYKFVDLFGDYSVRKGKERQLLPDLKMVYGDAEERSSLDIFWDLVKKHNIIPSEGDPKRQAYIDRILMELEHLANNEAKMDFLPYMFLLEDICGYVRSQDAIMTSRGSAGGCCVLYAIGVVITDPLVHKLPFERFLNPGRIAGGSLPDVDLDFEDRQLVIEYVKKKYGDRVALIANNSKLKLKSSILDCERSINNFVSKDTQFMTKKIPVPIGCEDEEAWLFKGNPKKGEEPFWDDPAAQDLRDYAAQNPEIWSAVKRCIGITKTRGVHAGGVMITPGPVNEFMPIIKTKSDEDFATAYDMNGVEYVGGIKFDLLGVKTIKAMGVSIRAIKKDLGIDYKWGEFAHDPEVSKHIFDAEQYSGLFQLDTNVAKPLARKAKPQNVQQISALVALGRPGCLAADSPDPNYKGSAADFYLDCAQENIAPYYIHDDLKPILEETCAIPVYQEQLMEIGTRFAGYTLGDADLIIRKGVGKKKQEKIDQFDGDLRKHLPDRGWNDQQIESLMSMVQASAKYSFNRCLSGDEKLCRPENRKNALKPTIREMYRIKNNPEFAKSIGSISLHRKYKREGYGYVLSLFKDGRVRKNKIIDIRHEGYQDIYKVTTASDKTILVTENHNFPTPKGKKRLKDLFVGDLLYVKGEYLKEETSYRFTDHKTGKTPKNAPKKGQKGFQNMGDTEHKRLLDFKRSDTSHNCKNCMVSFDNKRKEIHHIDGNHGNNDDINLVALCASCHKKEHYSMGRTKVWEKGLLSTTEKIVSIEYVKHEDVYDVEVNGPNHNFVVESGIVTSNSHSTSYAIVCWNGAVLKHKHNAHYWLGMLTAFADKEEKFNGYLKECRHLVLDVDITKSHPTDWVAEGDFLRPPLSIVNGCGDVGVTNLHNFIGKLSAMGRIS